MEGIEEIKPGFFNWVIGSMWGVVTFILAWITRNTLRANKFSELMAANIEGDKMRDKAIGDIKSDVKSIDRKVDNIVKCVGDQKEMYNSIHDLMIRQSKIIDELLG